MVLDLFEKAFVSRVMRREFILMLRLFISAKLVEMCFGSGLPKTLLLRAPTHWGGLYRPAAESGALPKILITWA
jgi:hypothetical protein